MKWRKKDVSESPVVFLGRNQKYVEAINFLEGSIQLVTCGWTDFEKIYLQTTLRMNPGTVNYVVLPYIKATEAEA